MYFFLVLLYLKYMCMCSISRISPSWARAGCKKTLCLLHYPRKIKFIHSFIHPPPPSPLLILFYRNLFFFFFFWPVKAALTSFRWSNKPITFHFVFVDETPYRLNWDECATYIHVDVCLRLYIYIYPYHTLSTAFRHRKDVVNQCMISLCGWLGSKPHHITNFS